VWVYSPRYRVAFTFAPAGRADAHTRGCGISVSPTATQGGREVDAIRSCLFYFWRFFIFFFFCFFLSIRQPCVPVPYPSHARGSDSRSLLARSRFGRSAPRPITVAARPRFGYLAVLKIGQIGFLKGDPKGEKWKWPRISNLPLIRGFGRAVV